MSTSSRHKAKHQGMNEHEQQQRSARTENTSSNCREITLVRRDRCTRGGGSSSFSGRCGRYAPSGNSTMRSAEWASEREIGERRESSKTKLSAPQLLTTKSHHPKHRAIHKQVITEHRQYRKTAYKRPNPLIMAEMKARLSMNEARMQNCCSNSRSSLT